MNTYFIYLAFFVLSLLTCSQWLSVFTAFLKTSFILQHHSLTITIEPMLKLDVHLHLKVISHCNELQLRNLQLAQLLKGDIKFTCLYTYKPSVKHAF